MAASGTPVVLSGAVGDYREFRPPAPLAPHLLCLWTNTLRRDGDNLAAVVPDGCVDIVWVGDELTVAGPDRVAAITTLPGGSTVIGARFRPGAAPGWLGLPMSEIVGSRLPLGEFWGAPACEFARRMGDAASTAERTHVMQTVLSAYASSLEPPSPGMGFAFNALKTDSAGPGLRTVLERLEISPRTLRRRCCEAFGYGPKTLDRILRFQRFLRLARQGEPPGLAALAFAAGYADQAHLTREVKRLSGFSPAEILPQLDA
jgi:AraC-like DNA-binding protein